MPQTKRVAAYVRVSRIGGRKGDGYISIPQQLDRIKQYADYSGWEVVDVFRDEDYSGGNVDRPAFQEALAQIEQGILDGLVVVRVDRFSRDVGDGVGQVRRIIDANGVFASATESIDVRDPVGEFVLVSLFNNAMLQLNMLKAGWVDAKRRAITRGAHIGPTPFGYVRRPKGGERPGCLDPHPCHADAVLRAFEMRRDGAVYSDIARYLGTIAPPTRGTIWSVSSVKRMLSQRAYLGEVHYRDRTGKGTDLVNLQAHAPIVPRDLWEEVQGMQTTGPHKTAQRDYVLRGMVRCAHCRRSMGGFTRGGNGQVPVYRCSDRTLGCDHRPVIAAEPLERYVLDAFWRAMDAERGRQADTTTVDYGQRIDALTAEIQDVESEMVRLSSREYRKQFSATVREAKERELQAELDELQRDLDSTRREAKRSDSDAFTFTRGDVDDEMVKSLLPSMINGVWVRSGRAPLERRVWVVLHDGPVFAGPSRGVTGTFGPIPWPEDNGSTLSAS
jgi:site-specific DNA recombinase